jgi:hypothetical protein
MAAQDDKDINLPYNPCLVHFYHFHLSESILNFAFKAATLIMFVCFQNLLCVSLQNEIQTLCLVILELS